MYDKAIAAAPTEMTCYNSEAAVLAELKQYRQCTTMPRSRAATAYEREGLSGAALSFAAHSSLQFRCVDASCFWVFVLVSSSVLLSLCLH